MKYCVRKDYFQFNPTKYSSVEQAYYSQDDNNCKIVKIFDNLESAKKHLDDCVPAFHRYSY